MTYTEWSTGAPGQPTQPVPPQDTWTPPEAPRRGGVKKLVAIGGPILGAGVIGLVSVTGLSGLGDPGVGDCVKASGAASWEVVDCGSDAAQYKVVGVEEDQETYPEFEKDPDVCLDFATAEVSLWMGPDGALGTVYCAEPL